MELGARLLPSPIARHHRDERQDDDDGTPRGDVRRGRGSGRGGGQHRPPADEPRRGTATPDAWIVCELSSFQLEDIDALRPADRGAAQPRARPSRPSRQLRGLPRREAPHLREPGRRRRRDRPAGFGPMPGEARRIEFAGDDPLPAEPLIPGAHNRENAAAATAAARAAGVPDERDRRGAANVPRRRAPDRGDRHDRRRALRQRLEGDERRGRAARARLVPRGAEARDPRRPREGRAVRGHSREAFEPGDRAYLIGEATDAIAAALEAAGVAFERSGDLAGAVAAAAREAREGDVVAALAGVRELRPVHELRAARGGVREAGAEAPGVKSDPTDSSNSASSSSSRSGSSRSGS